MAFITKSGNVTSFADIEDAKARDNRVFTVNESLLDDEDVVNALLVRATERILTKIRATDWWRMYFTLRTDQVNTIRTVADIPALNANYIKDRYNDFTDLCVYLAFAEFILPLVADFGKEDNAEVQKMKYYSDKADQLFDELITAGDWYDFDGSGTVTSYDKQPSFRNIRLVR